jgi:hypothetical protein
VKNAQEAFRQGDELFDVQKYDEAIGRYRESHEIVASPNSRLMVARSLRELGRLDEAFHEYEATLAAAEELAAESETYATTAAAARDELQALRSRVAWLSVDLGDVPEDAEITVAGKPVALAELDDAIVVVPGRVDIVATSSDGHAARGEVHLAAGREGAVTLKLDETVTVGQAAESDPESEPPAPVESSPVPPLAVEPEPEPRGGHRGLAFVAGGIGVAGLATFGVFGTRAKARFDDLEDACTDGACPASSQDDIDAGKQAQVLANIGLGVGVVGLGASVALFATGRRHRGERSVSLSIAPGSVSLKGQFR